MTPDYAKLADSDSPFAQRAAALLARGFSVIPVVPGEKRTVVGTGRRTRDPGIAALWAEDGWYDANVGLCADDDYTLLESDDVSALRDKVRELSGKEIPDTLQCGSGRENRCCWIFKRTPACGADCPGVGGLFEFRNHNQYVVGPGSIHPSGLTYRWFNDVAIVPMPTWLLDALTEIYCHSQRECEQAANTPGMKIPEGSRHAFFKQWGGKLRALGVSLETMQQEFLRVNREKFEVPKPDSEVLKQAQDMWQRWSGEAQYVGRGYTSDNGAGNQKKAKAESSEPPNPTVTFARPQVEGAVRECVLLSVKEGEYDGWFGRGRVHLVNGSSGAGKTTLMVDLLYRQEKAEMYLGHLGAGLSFLILFADRGALSNQETLARMGLTDARLNIGYLPMTSSGWESASEILGKIEAQEVLPGAVFVEGADMLVEDARDARHVTPFMHWLQKIAAHYHIALILSVGSGKSRPKDEYANRRDRSFGSEKWGRMSDTILALGIPPGGDDTDNRRVLDVLHRNAGAEKFDLKFSEGLLVSYVPEVEEMDEFAYWASAREWFTIPEAVSALQKLISRATVFRKVDKALEQGKLERRAPAEPGDGFFYRWRRTESHETDVRLD